MPSANGSPDWSRSHSPARLKSGSSADSMAVGSPATSSAENPVIRSAPPLHASIRPAESRVNRAACTALIASHSSGLGSRKSSVTPEL